MICVADLLAQYPPLCLDDKVNIGLQNVEYAVRGYAQSHKTTATLHSDHLYPEVIDTIVSNLRSLGYTVNIDDPAVLIIDWTPSS